MSSSSFLANFAAREWVRTKPKKSTSVSSARLDDKDMGLLKPEDASQRSSGRDCDHGDGQPYQPQETTGPKDADAPIVSKSLRLHDGDQLHDRLPLTRAQLHQRIETQGRSLKAALAHNELLEKQVSLTGAIDYRGTGAAFR